MSIMTVGIDLAKNVFAVHGVDENGKVALVKPKVPREQRLPLIAQLLPCLIGMEACSGAHYWARLFRQHGHTVKLMAPKFVTPYRMSGKRGKNDAADAAASYLRSLLVMGARAILSGLGDKQDGFSRWARSLLERRGYWKAEVAIAAKNAPRRKYPWGARLAWAVLHYGEDFRLNTAAI